MTLKKNPMPKAFEKAVAKPACDPIADPIADPMDEHSSAKLRISTSALISALIGAVIGSACACLFLTVSSPKTSPVVAVVDTERVIDAQKLYWIRAMNESAGNTDRVLKDTNAFPKKLTESLQAVARRHNVVLLDKKSVALTSNVPDYTEEVFALLELNAEEARRIESAIQKELFSSQTFEHFRR